MKQTSVLDKENSGAKTGSIRIVRNHQNRFPLIPVCVTQLFHQSFCVPAVKRPCRFVRKQNVRIRNQCSRRSGSLLLPSGHLRRKLIQRFRNIQSVRDFLYFRFCLVFRNTMQRKRKLDIFSDCQIVQQFKFLKQIADSFPPVSGKFLFAKS